MQGDFLPTQWALYFYRSCKDNLLAWWCTLFFVVSLLLNNSRFTSHCWIFSPCPQIIDFSSISSLWGFRFWVYCWHFTWGKHFLFTWHWVKYVFKRGFRWFPTLALKWRAPTTSLIRTSYGSIGGDIFSISWNCCWFCVILYVLSSFSHMSWSFKLVFLSFVPSLGACLN